MFIIFNEVEFVRYDLLKLLFIEIIYGEILI